ncbi:hypothetical protein BSL78_09600 [Apostichopus japonicus]|uniref:Uncharacterized protein n=1 Tax=Stichopus japonicus TaxID=307972 RepID=A0A2G8KZR1_STIJA|nr:hypothetical protein BSL78_09600 [Apostichopus japonicus]
MNQPSISSEMFNGLPNLISLSVSQLPLPLDSLPEQLLELTITDSSLSYIPPNFLHSLPSLETLVLSENMISDIAEGAFDGLNLLRNLDISGNYLTSVPGWMFAANFTALEKIFLQENRIERIFPEAFAGLTSLRSLTLESNLIKELPSDVFPPSLEYLQLGENPIKYLDVNVVSELTALRLFSVDSRNFQCDCLLRHFVDWLGINNVIVDGASDLRCNTPSRLRGVGLLQLNHRQLYCGPPSILTAPKAQNVTVRMGFNVTLPCSLLPHSVATLKWDTAKQNSLTMSSFYRTAYAINNYQLLPTGTLLVLNVSPLDGGTYTCTAANPAGTDIITYFVAVYQEKETTPQPPIQTTIITPISNTTAIVANRPTNLPQNTIKPTISNLNPVTQVIVNVTTVPPGAPPVPTNVTLGSTANNRTPVKITTIKPPTDSNVTLSSTANNRIPVKITTIKPTTDSVINLPTESPRTAVTNATLVDRQPSPNGTEQAPGTKSNTTHVEKLPQTGQGTNETDTRGKNGGHGQNNGIGQTTNLPSIVDGLVTKSSTTTLQTGLGSLPTKDPTKPIDPCNPNPCLHRGTCQVLSQKPQDPEEDSSQFDSYSESMSNGNDLGDEIDVERGKQSAQCTCRKKFGGPTCKIRKPEVPYQVTVLETHSNVITLEWAQKNVGNVDGYRIYYSLVGDRDMTKSMPIHRNVQSFTMEELKEDSTYRICVVAFNDGGDTPVGDENCIWADTKLGSKNIMALVKTEYGIIGGGILFVIVLTMLTAICYSKGKKERDYERSVVIPRVSQSVADLPPSNVFRRNLKPRESAFYQDDMMLLDLSRQSERKKYMNPFDSRHSIIMPDTEHINPPLGFGEGIPASLMPNNARRTLRIQEDMV